jgi:hypothetical protein
MVLDWELVEIAARPGLDSLGWKYMLSEPVASIRERLRHHILPREHKYIEHIIEHRRIR